MHSEAPPPQVRLLAPFDPLVWDRRRFSLLWSWEYRFEAYTPAAKRKLGYYALPMLYRDQVIGAANLTTAAGSLHSDLRIIHERPTERSFAQGLERELSAITQFLRLNHPSADFSKNALDPVGEPR